MPTAACYTSKWLPAVVSIAGRRAHVQRTMTVERRHWRGGHLRGATAGSLQTDLLQSVWRTRAKRSAGCRCGGLGADFRVHALLRSVLVIPCVSASWY